MKRLLPFLNPVLFAAGPVLSLYVGNAAEVRFAQVVPFLVAAAAGAVLTMLVFSLFLRSVAKGALVASLFVILFFLYGHAFDVLFGRFGIVRTFQAHVVIGLSSALLWMVGARVVSRARSGLDELTRAVTVAGLVLVALPLARLAPRLAAPASLPVTAGAAVVTPNGGSPARAARAPGTAPIAIEHADMPDVYYIILDGYAREDVLREIYDFDNRAFLAGLERRGFYVARWSHANYPQTYLSLASSLNMDYLDRVPRRAGEDPASRLPYYRMIQAPRVGTIFQEHGYRFVHFGTNWGGTETSASADEVIAFRPAWLRTEFATVLIRSTALRPLEPNLGEAYLRMFEALEGMARSAGPKFVFVHFTLPHNPYVFDQKGRIRTGVPLDLRFHRMSGGWGSKPEYVAQLRFVNRRITEVIDRLLAGPGPRPVILLQSDHGSATLEFATTMKERVAFLRERFPILNAYLVPDATRAKLTPTISPVNSFRLVLGDLFGNGFEPLEDRYYFRWYAAEDRLEEVTDFLAMGRRP